MVYSSDLLLTNGLLTEIHESESEHSIPSTVCSEQSSDFFRTETNNIDTENLNQTKSTCKNNHVYRRDPNLPKRPATPFLRFSVQYRPKVKAKFPQLTFRQTATVAANRWRSMSRTEKQPFEAEYQKDLCEFKQRSTDYKNSPVRKKYLATASLLKRSSGKNSASSLLESVNNIVANRSVMEKLDIDNHALFNKFFKLLTKIQYLLLSKSN